MTSNLRRKRSRHVALAIVGAASFAALAGCRQDKVDAEAFPDVESCRAAAQKGGLFSVQDCDDAYQQAETLHAESAPRYDSKALCEEEHGAGNCGTEEQVTGEQVTGEQGGGGMGIFMPLLAGYLMGNMLGGRGVAAQPLYRTPDGGYTNAAGTTRYSTNNGRAQLSRQQFAKPPVTAGKAPMTRASVASRGGFGRTGSSRGVFGG